MHNYSFSNGGFKLNLKLVLHLQSQSLTESVSFLNPPLLQAGNVSSHCTTATVKKTE